MAFLYPIAMAIAQQMKQTGDQSKAGSQQMFNKNLASSKMGGLPDPSTWRNGGEAMKELMGGDRAAEYGGTNSYGGTTASSPEPVAPQNAEAKPVTASEAPQSAPAPIQPTNIDAGVADTAATQQTATQPQTSTPTAAEAAATDAAAKSASGGGDGAWKDYMNAGITIGSAIKNASTPTKTPIGGVVASGNLKAPQQTTGLELLRQIAQQRRGAARYGR